MAFVFRADKADKADNNLDIFPFKIDDELKPKIKLKDNSKLFNENPINKSFVPFLSTSEKLIHKTEETPGPGEYNIDNNSENFIHKIYIKDAINNYKDSLYDLYSLINAYNNKKDEKPTPGPGEYNPSTQELFGGKIKKKKGIIKDASSSLYNKEFSKIEKMNELNNKKLEGNYITQYNINNINKVPNIDFNLTKRVQSYTMRELFQNLLKNNKKRNKNYENNISLMKSSNNKSEINLQRSILKKEIIQINNMKLFDKSKIFKNNPISEKIKEMNAKNKFKINSKTQENNFYLNEFINSKYFKQNPGPGYYNLAPIKKNNKNINNTNRLNNNTNKLLKNKNNLSHKNLPLEKYILKNKIKNKKIKRTKTVYQLQSDIIKYQNKKGKEINSKNKRSILL